MKRRDFLLLRTGRRSGLVELSCEQLYMRWLDTRLTGGEDDEAFDLAEDGEPPATYDERTTAQLFEDLNRDLSTVDTLRVVDREWLSGADEELRRGFGDLIARFRAHGGRVEFLGE